VWDDDEPRGYHHDRPAHRFVQNSLLITAGIANVVEDHPIV
jgi:hypothetical protein